MAISVLLCMACTEDVLVNGETGYIGKNAVYATLDFGPDTFHEVSVSTRSTQNEAAESRVYNLYVCFFVDGKKVYGHFFDQGNKKNGNAELTAENCWYVENLFNPGPDQQTKGKVRMKVAEMKNANLYVLANIHDDFMDMSRDKLDVISDEQQFMQLSVRMKENLLVRSGYFPMSAKVQGVNIDKFGKITGPDRTNIMLALERLDAKISVNIRVATDKEISQSGGNLQKLKSFEPQSWHVVNVPKNIHSFMDASTPTEFFDSEPVIFESLEEHEYFGQSTGLHGFSFYMLENVPAPVPFPSGGTFHDRDRRNKDDKGAYVKEGKIWKNAPEKATYLVIKGNVHLVIDKNNEKPQPIVAEATYYIHLGDLNKGMDNFSIRSNTSYTYNIIIKGINQIQVEVETSKENQPGATGNVYTARESISDFDSHYGQRVFRFVADYIEPDKVTWYVKTPFGRAGTPLKAGDTEVASGLDYEWVHILVNPLDESGQGYSDKVQPYPLAAQRQKLMTILEFTQFMKDQKRKLTGSRPHLFKPDKDGKLCIYATFFVDEFYYEKDPINGNTEDLWKKFVNQPPRMMHILCDNKISADGESSVTGSVVTIRQFSIQSPYTLKKPELKTAWGVDSEDDSHRTLPVYPTGENLTLSGTMDHYDGMKNMAALYKTVVGKPWSDYLEYTSGDVTLKKKCLMYLPLLCNRDEDGDGLIDQGELKWYIASEGQLIDLFLGDQGLSPEAQLYPISNTKKTGRNPADHIYPMAFKWRSHIVSSTVRNGEGQMIWAEEGISRGAISGDNSDDLRGVKSVRCCRNLGTGEVERLVKCDKLTASGDVRWRFDLSNINDKSLRAYSDKELDPDNEHSVSARLYKGFEVGKDIAFERKDKELEGFVYHTLYEALSVELKSGRTPCSNGWRVPNIREGALMSVYCDDWSNKYTLVSSFYSLGPLQHNIDQTFNEEGQNWNKKKQLKISWAFGQGNYASLFIKKDVKNIREVKDWLP